MGMLMHHTWEEMQKKQAGKKAKVTPVEEPKEEPVKEEPVKKTGGRRKTK